MILVTKRLCPLVVFLFLSCHSNTSTHIQQGLSPIIGPRSSYQASYDEKLRGWIIPANRLKASTVKPYQKGAESVPKKWYGEWFDLAQDYPKDFKKIYWIRGSHSSEGSIRSFLAQGYGVITNSMEALKGNWKQGKVVEMIFFHPQVPKAGRLTWMNMQTDRDKVNTFERGILFGCKIQDAYFYSFGSKAAKKAYPKKRFKKLERTPLPHSFDWRKKGLERIIKLLGDEYPYVVAGDLPMDPLFGTDTVGYD